MHTYFAVSALTLYYPVSDMLSIIGTVSILAGALAVFFSKRSKDNSNASTELINKLTQLRETDKEEFDIIQKKTNARIQELEAHHKDNEVAIANLTGQLNTYKNLPLKEWAESMKSVAITNKRTADALTSIDSSNQKILDTLKETALVAVQTKDAKPLTETTTIVTKMS